MGKKPGPTPIEADEMVDAIRKSPKPAVTVGDIAESLDVTTETIRRHRDKLEEHTDVEHGKVGRATAYWLSDCTQEPAKAASPTEPPEQGAASIDTANEEDDSKGILNRLFSGLPAFGSPLEVWALAGITAVLGLVVGVSIGIIIGQPPVGVATLAVSLVLAFALVVTLPVAAYYTFKQTLRNGVDTA